MNLTMKDTINVTLKDTVKKLGVYLRVSFILVEPVRFKYPKWIFSLPACKLEIAIHTYAKKIGASA